LLVALDEEHHSRVTNRTEARLAERAGTIGQAAAYKNSATRPTDQQALGVGTRILANARQELKTHRTTGLAASWVSARRELDNAQDIGRTRRRPLEPVSPRPAAASRSHESRLPRWQSAHARARPEACAEELATSANAKHGSRFMATTFGAGCVSVVFSRQGGDQVNANAPPYSQDFYSGKRAWS